MVAVFCLRLACGLLAALLLLSPAQMNARFFRTHFLTALGLTVTAAVFLREQADAGLWLALIGAVVLSFLGSVIWLLERARAGWALILMTVLALLAGLWLLANTVATDFQSVEPVWHFADDLASAALLGTATTAMLVGHSYLIAPTMSLAPLMRLLQALGVALVVRMTGAGVGLWLWTGQRPSSNLETEMLLWLPVRWALGLVAPLVLGWMAWETAKIRSTQSATGILYVVVIVCFLGELTSLLLLDKSGYIL